MKKLVNRSVDEQKRQNEQGEAELRLLIDHGRRQGYLSRGDILDIAPDSEFDGQQFNTILEKLSGAGIPWVDEGQTGETVGDELPENMDGAEHEHAAGTDPGTEGNIGVDILEGVETDDMVRLYVKEASQVPLLTAEEEVDLAERIERCRLALEELAQSHVRPKRQKELQRLIIDGRLARDRLIRANTRLVISVARKYLGRGLPFLDLIQEGNIGLMRAIRNFDYKRGFKFSTYAMWWIRQSIMRALAEQGRTIRLPVHLSDDVNRMLRIQNQLHQKYGRMPTQMELAEALEVPPAKVAQMIQVVRQPLSLQAPVGEEEGEELGNLIEDAEAPDPEETAIQITMNEDLQKRLEGLPSREREVIQLRYGIDGEEPMTLRDVGRRLGITRERARQLEVQAIHRMRNPSANRRRGSR